MASKFPNTLAFIKRYGDQVEKEIKNRLRGLGKVASGRLLKSIRSEVKEEKREVVLSFYMAEYGDYVDKGVEGAKSKRAGEGGKSKYKFKNKMPPEKPFNSWLRRKGIPKEKSFAVRRSIYLFGITPTNFFTIPTTRRKKDFVKGVEQNMIKDIDKLI